MKKKIINIGPGFSAAAYSAKEGSEVDVFYKCHLLCHTNGQK
ncbi:MAG TPA: hypothetical protein VLZ54_00775 [Arenibacter sp.]|nr:hypothetical protein [Arenibacter sp.]